MSRGLRRASRTASAYTPVTGVGWDAFFWTDGPEFLALGVADGGAVGTFPDEIGTLDLAQGTAGAKPTLRTTGGANSKSCLQADGGDHLVNTGGSTLTQGFSWVVLAQDDFPAASNHIIVGDGSVEPIIYVGGSAYQYYAGGSGKAGGTADTGWHLYMMYFNGASTVLEIDGTSTVTGDSGSSSGTGFNLFRYSAGAPWTGRAALLGRKSGDIRSDSGWTTFEDWVETYYGITVA